MIKKYIKKSMIVTGEQFDILLPVGEWPQGVEQDTESPTGYYYKTEKPDSIQEEGDPPVEMVDIKIPIKDKDFVYTDSRGERQVMGEKRFNDEYEVLN